MADRTFPDAVGQQHSQHLRSDICRLGSPTQMAKVSSHLRNWSVAESIALLGRLDSHPSIKAVPNILRAGAQFQQASGTSDNHFAHVAPCSLLVAGMPIQALFASQPAQARVARIFGMGVMAPPDWASLGTFPQPPVTQNRIDVGTESFHGSGGLVGAFEAACQAAAKTGRWAGDGSHQHNTSSLADFAEHHFMNVWKPAALSAYATACDRLGKGAGSGLYKSDLVTLQIGVLQSARIDFGHIADATIAATQTEDWSK